MKLFLERKKYILMVVSIFLVNYSLDRLTKYIAVQYLKDSGSLNFFNNFFVLTYTENTGAFLSLGAAWNIYVKYFVLLIVPIIVCIAAFMYLMLKETKIYRVILGSCIIGGGIGNLADRLFNEFSVIDFMNFGIGNLRTGILNIADLSVTFGVILLVIYEIALDRKKAKDKSC